MANYRRNPTATADADDPVVRISTAVLRGRHAEIFSAAAQPRDSVTDTLCRLIDYAALASRYERQNRELLEQNTLLARAVAEQSGMAPLYERMASDLSDVVGTVRGIADDSAAVVGPFQKAAEAAFESEKAVQAHVAYMHGMIQDLNAMLVNAVSGEPILPLRPLPPALRQEG